MNEQNIQENILELLQVIAKNQKAIIRHIYLSQGVDLDLENYKRRYREIVETANAKRQGYSIDNLTLDELGIEVIDE